MLGGCWGGVKGVNCYVALMRPKMVDTRMQLQTSGLACGACGQT